jgi:phage tail sheath protein FI
MTRPGVYVSEAPLPRVVANPNTSEALGGFLGTALRGPTTPTFVTSWSDFVSKFGGFGSGKTLPDALYQFFNNGGGNAYVSRVLASDAATAGKTTTDTRLDFDARSPGVWGNGITVDIAVNATTSTFTLSVRENIRGSDVVVERFRDLSMDQTSPRYVESIVNSSTVGSQYIVVTDVDKDDTALADGGSTALTGGSEGVAPIVAGDYSAAFDDFDAIDANFVFNAPGVPDVSALVTKIEGGRQDSIIVVDTAENQSPDMTGASLPSSSYAAVYYPWIYISDPAPDAVRGGIKKVPPGASVVGMILRTDTSRGVFKAPAGVASTLTGAVANEQRLTNTELDDLAGMNVNVVRPVPGAGIAVMGARTRAFGTTDQYISVRRTINFVKKRAVEVSRFALFEPNTPALWEQLRVANGAFLSELWQIGGLAGLDFSQAFYVKCDSENNTTQTISNGEVHVEIGIAPAFPAEFVVIRVGQFEADASTVVTEEV